MSVRNSVFIQLHGEQYEIPREQPTDIIVPEYNIRIKDSILGVGTVIWSSVNIYGAQIGDNVRIGAFVEIRPTVRIGGNCKIEPFVFIPEGVTIEDGVFVGPHVVFTNDLYPRAVNEDGSIVERYEIAATLVRRNASIGAGSVLRCGVEIGERALIGLGSVIVDDVPPYAIVYGPKASEHGYVER